MQPHDTPAGDSMFDDDDASEYLYDYGAMPDSASDDDPLSEPDPATRRDMLAAALQWRLRRVILAGAFLTPLVVLGVLLLAIDAINGHDDPTTADSASPPPVTAQPLPTASYALAPQWPTEVVFIPHTTPARIRNLMESISTKHGYRFEGQVGDVWQIAAGPYQGSGATPILLLYGPTGARVCAVEGCLGEPQSSMTVTLADSGTYRLVVEPAGTTGTYLLTLDSQ